MVSVAVPIGMPSPLSPLVLPQHAYEHRPKGPAVAFAVWTIESTAWRSMPTSTARSVVLLAVDQELGEGADLGIPNRAEHDQNVG
jgi:hypothetical protein